jgi:hypothetical protein
VHVRVGGTFTLHPASAAPGARSLFVAGGIGVTPLASILAELVERWAAAPDQPQISNRGDLVPQAVLLYSARAPHEFALLPRLLGLQAASAGRLQVRLHCSEYASPPPSEGGGGAGGAAAGGGAAPALGGACGGAGAAAEAAAAGAPAVLLRGGARSLLRRRMLPEDLDAALTDLLAGAPLGAAGSGGSGGGASGGKATAYVCGPPALSDAVVAQLEADSGRVGEVVLERWW